VEAPGKLGFWCHPHDLGPNERPCDATNYTAYQDCKPLERPGLPISCCRWAQLQAGAWRRRPAFPCDLLCPLAVRGPLRRVPPSIFDANNDGLPDNGGRPDQTFDDLRPLAGVSCLLRRPLDRGAGGGPWRWPQRLQLGWTSTPEERATGVGGWHVSIARQTSIASASFLGGGEREYLTRDRCRESGHAGGDGRHHCSVVIFTPVCWAAAGGGRGALPFLARRLFAGKACFERFEGRPCWGWPTGLRRDGTAADPGRHPSHLRCGPHQLGIGAPITPVDGETDTALAVSSAVVNQVYGRRPQSVLPRRSRRRAPSAACHYLRGSMAIWGPLGHGNRTGKRIRGRRATEDHEQRKALTMANSRTLESSRSIWLPVGSGLSPDP